MLGSRHVSRTAMRRPRLRFHAACSWLVWIICTFACGRDRLTAVADEVDAAVFDSNRNQASGGSSSICGMLNASCTTGSDCCSGLCESVGPNRICLAPPTCRAGGDTCVTGADCCSHVCGPDHLCPSIFGCAIAGEPCATNANCCSGACSDPGTGTRTCQALDGCLPIGEICSLGSDCCSQSCVLDSSVGIGRCSPAPNCAAIGEICTTLPPMTPCCGSAPVGGPSLGTCQVTGAGVTRCMTPSPFGQCMTASSVCQIHEQCCSRFCLPTDTGQFMCANGCSATGARCGASRDCCDDASCINGTCQMTGISCRQIGVNCSTGADCCSTICDPGKMTCVVPMN